MNYEDITKNHEYITKITADRIDSYMTQAINADSKGVAEMFHNAAWGGGGGLCGLNSPQK